MNKKISGFSIFEVLIVIVVIAIISSIAITKITSALDKTAIVKLKTDILNIQTAISLFATKQTFTTNNLAYPQSLDECSANTPECNMFIGNNSYKLLKQPIISANSANIKSGSWTKVSSSTYRAWITQNDFIDFTYTQSDGSFKCNQTNELCKELSK